MAVHMVSAPVSGFHIGECTDVEQGHFWSQGLLVNGVRSWQLIIKHDLTHQFHGWKLGGGPIVRVPHRWIHRCGTVPLLERESTCEWYQKLAIDYKTWFDTSVSWLDTWCLPSGIWLWNMIWCIGSMARHFVSAPVSGFHIGEGTDVELAHIWRPDPLVNGVRSWQLIIKHDLTHRFYGQTLGVRPSGRVSHRRGHRCGTGPLLEPVSTCECTDVDRSTSGARVLLWMVSEVGNWL